VIAMARDDDGYEQMMRIEDPYWTPPDTDLDALRLAESQYGAVGTGNLGDVERKREPARDAAPDAPDAADD
jgi:hypothetical protein